MVFALAIGVFLVSRPLGYLALADAVIVVAGTRVYTGIHYPTDVIAGAFLGAATVLALNADGLKRPGNFVRRIRYPTICQFRGAQCDFNRVAITHFTDENDLRSLTQSGSEAIRV